MWSTGYTKPRYYNPRHRPSVACTQKYAKTQLTTESEWFPKNELTSSRLRYKVQRFTLGQGREPSRADSRAEDVSKHDLLILSNAHTFAYSLCFVWTAHEGKFHAKTPTQIDYRCDDRRWKKRHSNRMCHDWRMMWKGFFLTAWMSALSGIWSIEIVINCSCDTF